MKDYIEDQNSARPKLSKNVSKNSFLAEHFLLSFRWPTQQRSPKVASSDNQETPAVPLFSQNSKFCILMSYFHPFPSTSAHFNTCSRAQQGISSDTRHVAIFRVDVLKRYSFSWAVHCRLIVFVATPTESAVKKSSHIWLSTRGYWIWSDKSSKRHRHRLKDFRQSKPVGETRIRLPSEFHLSPL